MRKDFSLEKECGCIQSLPAESIKNRLDKCYYCHMDIVAPALDKESPSSLWSCCFIQGIPYKVCPVLASLFPEPRPQHLLELIFFLEIP